jgi:hypothetical protein
MEAHVRLQVVYWQLANRLTRLTLLVKLLSCDLFVPAWQVAEVVRK